MYCKSLSTQHPQVSFAPLILQIQFAIFCRW